MMHRLSAFAVAAALALPPTATRAQEIVHGADSLFVSPSVKLAWAVKRGASETETLVIIRVIAEASHRVIRLDGVDPFTKDRKAFVAARPLDREADLSVPRASFADHPSTEIHFFVNAEDAAANKPKLTVFYLGVPDTTPEFAHAGEAEAYLDRMLRAQR
jgi:hypothetical protein